LGDYNIDSQAAAHKQLADIFQDYTKCSPLLTTNAYASTAEGRDAAATKEVQRDPAGAVVPRVEVQRDPAGGWRSGPEDGPGLSMDHLCILPLHPHSPIHLALFLCRRPHMIPRYPSVNRCQRTYENTATGSTHRGRRRPNTKGGKGKGTLSDIVRASHCRRHSNTSYSTMLSEHIQTP
jgi:hypothetical protein